MHFWGFCQILEAYKPERGREWGYFCLPILRNGELVDASTPSWSVTPERCASSDCIWSRACSPMTRSSLTSPLLLCYNYGPSHLRIRMHQESSAVQSGAGLNSSE